MAQTKRIGLYSPYVPEHAGGGERYMMSVAEILSESHDVTVLLARGGDEQAVRKKYERAFHLDLSRAHFKQTAIGTHTFFLTKLLETSQYDVLYYLTDGSLFFSLAKRNILHIQFPFAFAQSGLINRVKLWNWRICNTNSAFTKKIIERWWKIPVPFVHYPYVDSALYLPATKEKIILSVGRFFSGEKSVMHCKRQDIMVKVFRSMVNHGLKGWKLVLIGSIDPGEDNAAYATRVATTAKGYPIKILHNASFDMLKQYYAVSSVYWHAAGFGIDEEKEPTKVEHFGISPLEAMSSEAVPVVVGKGGLKEIVEHGVSGFLWQTEEELAHSTAQLIENHDMMETMGKKARERAKFFSKERFRKTLEEMIG